MTLLHWCCQKICLIKKYSSFSTEGYLKVLPVLLITTDSNVKAIKQTKKSFIIPVSSLSSQLFGFKKMKWQLNPPHFIFVHTNWNKPMMLCYLTALMSSKACTGLNLYLKVKSILYDCHLLSSVVFALKQPSRFSSWPQGSCEEKPCLSLFSPSFGF